MKTNKRNLKKAIQSMAEAVVTTVLPSAVYAKAITEQRANEIISNMSAATATAMSRLAVSFDKRMAEFESRKAYNAARTAYYKAAFEKAHADFKATVADALKEINESLKK